MDHRRKRSRHGRGHGRRPTPPAWRLVAAALLLCGLGVGIGLAGCGGGSGSSTGTPPADSGAAVRAELLFVVQATGAGISLPDAGGRVILHLTGVAPSLLAFADRPLRIASTRPTASLVDGWADDGFAADPPNGALTIGGATLGEPLALELREPRYDTAAATLDFTVTSLLPDLAAALHALVANGSGCSVALFIDATQPVASGAPPATQDVVSVIDLVGSMTGRTFSAEQQELISGAVVDLLRVAAQDSTMSNPELIQSNVALFIDDLQQVLGTTFSTDQRRLLTSALVRMIEGAVA